MTRPPTSPKILGRRGEDLAERWYAERGWQTVERNWSDGTGEIDLIVADPTAETLVFCEVKARSSNRYGSPAEAVDSRKQLRLRRLAAAWLRGHPGWKRVRFDVAAVISARVTVYEDAF